jgi:uncharacterized protein (DUF1778 family)
VRKFNAKEKLYEAGMTAANPKNVVINLRVNQSQCELIGLAAKTLGKSRSAFIMESALRAAEQVLSDRVFFHLDEAAYEQFIAALERPQQVNERLLDTLSAKAPWE